MRSCSDSYAGFITLCSKYSRFFMGFVVVTATKSVPEQTGRYWLNLAQSNETLNAF